ncbi:hypothetical protein AGMMS49975_01850 [Clostridia bacterium]|nr:hypothetical protein AGMMS49975_01850 [Clostridia bacterium]
MENKVLVCITPQGNSRRLIDKGAEIAADGELHILHIEKGGEVFNTEGAARMIQELFDYASKAGGIVHGMCSDNIAKTIKSFVLKEKISALILGETDKNYKAADESVLARIQNALPDVNIYILERQE